MKTLYSSTFLSAILGFLMLLGQSETPIELKEGQNLLFRSILRSEVSSPLQNQIPVTIYTGLTCTDCRNFGRFTLLPLHEAMNENEEVDLEVVLVANLEDEAEVLGVKAAHCAADQQQFWTMLQALFEMEMIENSIIQEKITERELDAETFNTCMEAEATQDKLIEATTRWEESGLEKLPSTTLHDVTLVGAQPVENIQREIRRLLPLLMIED